MIRFALLCTLFLTLTLGLGHAQPPNAKELRLFAPVEWVLSVEETFENPYNPDVVTIDAIFTRPDGNALRQPAFFMLPVDDNSNVAATGEWRLRFTPDQIGQWDYRIELASASGTSTLDEGTFSVVPAEDAARGFIRVAENNRYFRFQNGDAYFPVGANFNWSWEDGGGLESYIIWLDNLAAAGGNYARLIADTAWFIGLDWGGPAGDYTNDQADAYQLDRILDAAAERDIYLQIVLIWHQSFIQSPGLPVNPPADVPRADTSTDWDSHPYNVLNGGVMNSPADFAATQALLQQKLRYAVARWGHSPNIFAWELISDVDQLAGFDPIADMPFIDSLADTLRELDAYGHLITAGSRDILPELINNPRLDFAQVSYFHRRPVEDAPNQLAGLLTLRNNPLLPDDKPLLLNQFSLNPWYEPTADDPRGVHLQNTLWASSLAGFAGAAVPQWGDSYIHANDLYDLLTPIATFSESIPWHTLDLRPTQAALTSARNATYSPRRIDDFNRAFRETTPADTIYVIGTDQNQPSTATMSSYLYGSGLNGDRSLPLSLVVTPPIDTNLIIKIRDISPGSRANLFISLDDVPYASFELNAGSEDATINIPLAAGQHRVLLDNIGEDWVELDYIEIADYISTLSATTLVDSDAGLALSWVQHREDTWQNSTAGDLPTPLRFSLGLPALPPGNYEIDMWDTLAGAIVGHEVATVAAFDQLLTVDLLPLRGDIAVVARRVSPLESEIIAPTILPTRTPRTQPSATASPSPSVTASPTQTASPTATASPTPQPPSATVTPTASLTASPTATDEDLADPQPNPETDSAGEGDVPNGLERATRTPRPGQANSSPTPTHTLSPTPQPSEPPAENAVIPRLTRTPRPDGD